MPETSTATVRALDDENAVAVNVTGPRGGSDEFTLDLAAAAALAADLFRHVTRAADRMVDGPLWEAAARLAAVEADLDEALATAGRAVEAEVSA